MPPNWDLKNFQKVILQAFDPDLRNGYAHADYVVWDDGIRLRRRNGGWPKVVSFDEFTGKLNKAITFFQTLREMIGKTMREYSPQKRIVGRMNSSDPNMPAIISYDPGTGAFSIQTGLGL
jgi:hypothetical protein